MSKPILHHMHVTCNELEPMIVFWEAACGAKLEERRTFSGGAPGAVLDIGAKARLYLKQVSCRLPEAAMAGVDHLGLAVEDLDAACKTACEVPGVRLDTPPTLLQSGSRIAFIRGPEEILVELVEVK